MCAYNLATDVFEHAREHVEDGGIIIDDENCMGHWGDL
ncbi:hypothetical protein BF49_3774 [Bradyrhizobium sp.]|nr:hypothetical protein BF49_3774 [Bradyrhizobium sp.]